MNPQQQELLAQLNDLAQPVQPGWWPLAAGWWLGLFLLLCLAVILFGFFKARAERKNRDVWRQSALQEHQRLYHSIQHVETHPGLIAGLSVLMRRVALAVEPRGRVAALTDDQWLLKLDAIGHTTEYSDGVGKILLRHQYQRAPQLDDHALNSLFSLTADTIRQASPALHQANLSAAQGSQKGGTSVAEL